MECGRLSKRSRRRRISRRSVPSRGLPLYLYQLVIFAATPGGGLQKAGELQPTKRGNRACSRHPHRIGVAGAVRIPEPIRAPEKGRFSSALSRIDILCMNDCLALPSRKGIL